MGAYAPRLYSIAPTGLCTMNYEFFTLHSSLLRGNDIITSQFAGHLIPEHLHVLDL